MTIKELSQLYHLNREIEIKSDDYKAAATFLMMMHRHGYKYLYRAMDIETGEIVMSTTKNEFQ